ncbi:MAG TPA: hypothetical protein VG165_15910 [Solirubrobacteraceae bacterium]|jgi:hypothetical protein|nr:hypothetical protein [Solirubrobacteraceae bacterium]
MRRLATIVLAGGLGLFGCRSQIVPSSEFLSRGNAACAAATRRINDLAAPRPPPRTAPERFAGYVDDYVAEIRLELINLRAIGYPAGQRARLESDYRGVETVLDAAERNPLGFRPQLLVPADLALRRDGLASCRP